MKYKKLYYSPLLAGSLLLAAGPAALAADGLWDVDVDGNWSVLANWNAGAGPVADGADFTATFDDVITADRVVTLDTIRTIGNITFSDLSHHLTISGANILTLDTTSGTPTISVADEVLTISSVIAGNDGLLKSGSGDFRPRGLNTFTGGVELADGIINLTNDANEASFLGDAANVLTFTGDARLHNNSGEVTVPQGITINGGVTGEVTGAFGETFLIDGVLAGTGNLAVNGFSAGYKAEFRNTANTFTGPIEMNSGDSMQAKFASLLDSPGVTTIGLDSQNNNGATFEYSNLAITPLVLNNRQFELIANGNSGTNTGRQAQILNNASIANTMTIAQDLLITGTGTKHVYLGGGNTGDNTFAGAMTDGVDDAAFTLYKVGGGKWILSGANTYTGDTIITNGSLEIGGAGQLGSGGIYPGNITNTDGSPNDFVFNSTADTTISGVISGNMALTKDGAGTLSITGSASQTGGTNVDAGTLSLGDGTNNSNLSGLATLSVATGATLDLNYAGSNAVLALNLEGSPAALGTWGRIGSIAGLGADFESSLITGDGLINNLGGVLINHAFWDGGTVDILTDGNASGTDVNGTWDTTILNWDIGITPHAAWPNTTADKASFNRTANSNRTITLGSDITLGEIDLRGTVNSSKTLYFGDAAEDNTLTFGGVNKITMYNYYVNFRSGIAGSPLVDYTSRSGDNSSALTLAPVAPLTMTLGVLDMKKNPASNKNAILNLDGDSDGNTADSVTWSSGGHQLTIFKKGASTWTAGGFSVHGDSRVRVQAGTLIANGTWNPSHLFDVESGGTLGGTGTLSVTRAGATEIVRVLDGGTISPGASVGTLNIDEACSIAGTLKVEVDGATADVLAIAGDLDLSAVTDIIEVVELSAATLASYTVVTYTGSLIGTFDTATLPAGYSVDYGTANEINLVVGGGGGSAYDTWAGGAAFDADTNGDGVTNGMAFLLGAADPSEDATDRLPVVTDDGSGGLVMTFSMLNAAARGASVLNLEHSSDLGLTDAWSSGVVPETSGTVDTVIYDVTANTLNDVVATIPAAGNADAGKLFGRLVGEQ
jgi:fibronectin-binding autotransporter adhesin